MAGMQDAVPREWTQNEMRNLTQQTRDEANSANAAMLLETQALHAKQQAIVKFVDGVPDMVAALKVNLDEVTEFLKSSGMPALADSALAKYLTPKGGFSVSSCFSSFSLLAYFL